MTTDSEHRLQELRDQYQDARSHIINPDYYNGSLEKNLEANRQHQIGAHERVARRRARLTGHLQEYFDGKFDGFYQGPQSTHEERNAAYDALVKENPQWDVIS